MFRYTVIIPHKNTPQLLQRCLDSTPIREDLEVIIIDDYSDKSIVNFTNFPGNSRPYTKIILNKSNKGAGHARNIGIDNSNGEWILFADADDYFYPDKLNLLLNSNLPKQYDVIVYGADYLYLDGTSRVIGMPQNNHESISFHERTDVSKIYSDYCIPWIKMVRRKKIIQEKLRFEEIRWGNDMMFSAKLALHVNAYALADIIIYHHERRIGSLVETTNNYNAYACRTNSFFRINKLLKKNNKTLLPTEGYLSGLYQTGGYFRFILYTIKSFYYCGKRQTIIAYNKVIQENAINRIILIAALKQLKKSIKRCCIRQS